MSSLPYITQALADAIKQPVTRIQPDCRLEDLDVDSLTITELIFDLEDHFSIELGNSTPKLVIVRDIADLIDRAVQAKTAT